MVVYDSAHYLNNIYGNQLITILIGMQISIHLATRLFLSRMQHQANHCQFYVYLGRPFLLMTLLCCDLCLSGLGLPTVIRNQTVETLNKYICTVWGVPQRLGPEAVLLWRCLVCRALWPSFLSPLSPNDSKFLLKIDGSHSMKPPPFFFKSTFRQLLVLKPVFVFLFIFNNTLVN